MSIFKKDAKKPFREQLFNVCISFIEKYEADDLSVSCKDDLSAYLKRGIWSISDATIESLGNNIDYYKFASSMVLNSAFDLLASGQYHISRGMLNPMSCASNLMDVYNGCIDYAVQQGYITEIEKEQNRFELTRAINLVG